MCVTGFLNSGVHGKVDEGCEALPHLPVALSHLSIVQMSHKESEDALQKRLDEVSRELCRSQTSHASLRADAEKAQEQQQQMKGKWIGPGSASAGACVLSPRPPPPPEPCQLLQ